MTPIIKVIVGKGAISKILNWHKDEKLWSSLLKEAKREKKRLSKAIEAQESN